MNQRGLSGARSRALEEAPMLLFIQRASSRSTMLDLANWREEKSKVTSNDIASNKNLKEKVTKAAIMSARRYNLEKYEPKKQNEDI